MSFSFSRLFNQKSATGDSLTQPQREAIVDLLHYCLYADNHIALAETEVLNKIVSDFSWDPKAVSFGAFESKSIAAARQAKENEGSREEFLKAIGQRLDTPESRRRAFELCKKLFVSDGVQSDKETVVLARIQQLLG